VRDSSPGGDLRSPAGAREFPLRRVATRAGDQTSNARDRVQGPLKTGSKVQSPRSKVESGEGPGSERRPLRSCPGKNLSSCFQIRRNSGFGIGGRRVRVNGRRLWPASPRCAEDRVQGPKSKVQGRTRQSGPGLTMGRDTWNGTRAKGRDTNTKTALTAALSQAKRLGEGGWWACPTLRWDAGRDTNTNESRVQGPTSKVGTRNEARWFRLWTLDPGPWTSSRAGTRDGTRNLNADPLTPALSPQAGRG
jgi:hypothetical protein